MLNPDSVEFLNTPSQISLSKETAHGAIAALSRIGGKEVNSARDVTSLSDIFNCLTGIQHAVDGGHYIANEGGEYTVAVTSWNTTGLSTFLSRLAEEGSMAVTPQEQESLRAVSRSLRGN
jgi:dipeptidyl aminopeptidase/acylaminoacyl peptidase